MGNRILACSLTLIIVWHGPTTSAQAIHPGDSVWGISLQDQYGKPAEFSAYRGLTMVILYGDRRGKDFVSRWVQGVRRSCVPDYCVIIQAADLRGVPWFMRGTVDRSFHGRNSDGTPAESVLLDWKGQLADSFGANKNLTNVYVVDSRGTFVMRVAGRGTDGEIQNFLTRITTILRR